MSEPQQVSTSADTPAAARGRRRYQRGPHLFRRGEWWYLRIPKGNPPERALRTRDGREADRLFREYLDGRRGAEGVAADAAAAELPLAEIAKRWTEAPHGWTKRTRDTYSNRAVAIVTALEADGIKLPSQITADAVDRMVRTREGDVARATINRDLTAARRMLAWATDPDRRLCNPTPLERRKALREPKRKPRKLIPDPAQIAKTVKALSVMGEEAAALAVATAAATGLRLEELRRIRPTHLTPEGLRVDPEAGPARDAWESKGYESRTIPLSRAARDVTARLADLLSGGKGGRGRAIGLAGTWIARRIDAASKRAGVPPFRMHDLRRAFATEAVSAGVPIRVVAQWLSHKDIATTEGYVGRYSSDTSLIPPTPAAIRSLTKGRAESRTHRRLDGGGSSVPRAGKR